MAHRKLQQEIDRVFKKINEGLEVFDGLHERHEMAENPTLREKIETELKKEVKKLQKLREQVKVWQASSEVKDKDSLLTHRRKVEVAMEQYKAVEKGSKVKAYSNTSLRSREDMDPEEKEKMETIQFMQESIEELERLYEVVDVDIEKLSSKKGKKAIASALIEKDELKLIQGRYRWHQQQLEIALRLLENDQLDYTEMEPVKEDLEYFLQHNREDDFVENEYIYESLDLDANETLQKEIAEGFGLLDDSSVSPSPAKSTREPTPQTQGSISTPKSKKITPVATTPIVPSPSLIGSSSTLRPARVPAEQVKWSALAAGVDEAEKLKEKEEKERKEKEEQERLEREDRELREREQKEKEERERKEREEREERERFEREERERREREEQQQREVERQRREEERKKREVEKREREERELEKEREKERERERKRERRLQSLGLKDTEPQQIIITGSSPALLKRLEEQKRLEEEEMRLQKEQDDEQDESMLSGPLDEAMFKKDAELALLPPGLQDIVCSYYDSRRTNDKIVSSVAQSCRPPRQYLPTTAVPSLTACVELNRALNIWALVRPQLAQLGSATTSAVASIPTSPIPPHSASPSPPPSSLPVTAGSSVSSAPGLLNNNAVNGVTESNIFTNLDNGTLFYAFYYALTPFETNIAEKELLKRSWRADVEKRRWFLRADTTPVKQGQGFEVASYKKFDAETWSLQDLVNYKLDYDTLAIAV